MPRRYAACRGGSRCAEAVVAGAVVGVRVRGARCPALPAEVCFGLFPDLLGRERAALGSDAYVVAFHTIREIGLSA